MNSGHPGSMIAAKFEGQRIPASQRCPSCGHELDCKLDMVGLPAGVKFDPTDQELLEHLEAKVNEEGSMVHPLIDEFILTIQGEYGICYTHPGKLPGVTKDGLSKHFFHRPPKAYTTGKRKRRKIQAECDHLPSSTNGGETRWHKTGKTRPVMVAGRQKGCKKILVLYNNFGKQRKPEKTNWVMHQYHLGDLEEEKEGELIVSKIFYQMQPRQSATMVALDQPGAKQHSHGLPRFEVSVAAAPAIEVQRQQQHRRKQVDGKFSSAPTPKRLHEVGVDDQVKIVRGEQDDHHHMPSQHDVSANLQMTLVPATSSISSQASNLSTIASPATQHTSVVLNNQLDSPAMPLRNDNFQVNNQNKGKQQKLDKRSAGLEELIMACQSTSTRGGTSIPRSQETQWPYQRWPPDKRQPYSRQR